MKFLSLTILLLSFHFLYAQTDFKTALGSSACYEEAYSVVETADGYLISATVNCSSNPQQIESLLIQLDSNGDSVSARQNVIPNGYMRTTTDGQYIFLGGNKAGLVYDSILIVKTNEQSDTVWTSYLNLSKCANNGYDIINTADGGYAVTGIYATGTNCNNISFNSFIAKLDANGQVQWTNFFRGAGNDELFIIRQLSDGGYALFGWTDSQGEGDVDYYLIRTNEQGDSIWSKTYGGPGNDYGYGMDITPEGGFILVGYSDVAVAIKTDANGNIIWEKILAPSCAGTYFKAITTLDQNFAFLINENTPGRCSSSLIKTDLTGNVLWRKNWGGLFREVSQPAPGSFLLAGYLDKLPNPPDVYVVRFDTTFIQDTTGDFTKQVAREAIKVYPNPAQSEIYLDLPFTYTGSYLDIEMIDTWGQRKLYLSVPYARHLKIPGGNLSRGMYFLNFKLEDGSEFTYKMILN